MSAPQSAGSPPSLRHTLTISVGLTLLLSAMLLAFALPAANTGAHGVPVGVVGTTAVGDRIEQLATGFEVTRYADAQAATTAIENREIYGALVVDAGGVQTLTATAASTSAATLVQNLGQNVAAAVGTTATVTDLRPFPDADPRGAGLAAGALPMALGGWIGAIVIARFVHTPGRRLLVTAVFSVIGGLGLTATLQFLVGTLAGNYLLTSLGAMLGIAATAVAVQGLRHLLGGLGLAIAGVLLILLGNPLSGLSSAPEMLPTGWGALGQLLPPGATGTLLRSLAFFDGHGAGRPALVLGGWLLGGAILLALGIHRQSNATEPEAGAENYSSGTNSDIEPGLGPDQVRSGPTAATP